jgi:hypothetical protein
VGLGPLVRDLGALFYSRTNGRRRRSPSTRNVRQSRRHGRGILCPHAYGYSSGAGKCAGWCHHHAWDAKFQIRPSRASLAASLLAARYGLLVALCPAVHFRLGRPTRKYLKATRPSPAGNRASHFKQRILPCTTSQVSNVTILYSASQVGQLKGIGFDGLIVRKVAENRNVLRSTNESGAYVP